MGVVRQVDIGAGEAVLVDELGTESIVTAPSAEDAVLLDLGGKLNRVDERWSGRFLLAPGQAAELVAELVAAGSQFSDPEEFMGQVASYMRSAFGRDESSAAA